MKWIKINGHYIEPENIEEIRDAYEKGYEIPEPVYRRKINLYEEFNKIWLREVFKILKPGGYLLSFSSTKTYHRLGSAVEEEGFEIKDQILNWCYGEGFPKSRNIWKHDVKPKVEEKLKEKGVEGDIEWVRDGREEKEEDIYKVKLGERDVSIKQVDGKFIIPKIFRNNHTNLKPAHEPILLAQKPREGTYCENIEKYGVGGINIDGCRNSHNEPVKKTNRQKDTGNVWNEENSGLRDNPTDIASPSQKGRFPANLLLTHHPDCEYKGEKKVKGHSGGEEGEKYKDNSFFGNAEQPSGDFHYVDENGMETVSDWDCHPSCPVRNMNEQSGNTKSGGGEKGKMGGMFGNGEENSNRRNSLYFDKGGAARYFNQFHFVDEDFFKYQPKASKSERNKGCENLYWKEEDGKYIRISKEEYEKLPNKKRAKGNNHCTVKSLELMKWLVRLVTPEGGIILDPFLGSGTTVLACIEEDMRYIGFDKNKHSIEIAKERRKYYKKKKEINSKD